jgi:hypothetical protein
VVPVSLIITATVRTGLPGVDRFGVITVDVEAELAKLDGGGWRPLRPTAPDLSLLL